MTKRAATIVIAAFFTTLIAYSIRYGYGMLLPDMIKSMGISKTSAGTIYSSYFLSYTLFSPLIGWISDKYNIRVILFFFTLLLSVGAFLMAYATTVFNASCFFVLSGIGHAACWAPVMALVQKSVADKSRGAALAITSMGSAVGIFGLSLILPVIVSHYTWRGGWISMGVFGFFVAVLNLLLVRKQPSQDLSRINMVKDFPAIVNAKPFWAIGISYSLVGFSVLVPYTFLGSYSAEQLHFSYEITTRCFAIMAISGIIGKITLGYLSDILGRVCSMIICNILLGIGCLGITLFNTVGMIYFFSALFGFGFGAVWPIYAAAAPDFFPQKLSGSVIGLWTAFMGIGSILSPTVCGLSIDKTDGYATAFMMGAICAIGSTLLLIPLLKIFKHNSSQSNS